MGTSGDRIGVLARWLVASLSLLPLAAAAQPAGTRTGTGFAVSEIGHLISSFHVVQGAKSVLVIDPARTFRLPATVVGVDERNDLALLKVDRATVPLALADFSGIPTGLEVFALGYPQPTIQGNSLKITSGIINSLEGLRGYAGAFQFSAPIQLGNSGGPIVSPDGLVVGVAQSRLDRVSSGRNEISVAVQNVNIAVNSRRLEEFLLSYGVGYRKRGLNASETLRPSAIFDRSAPAVFMVAALDAPDPGVGVGQTQSGREKSLTDGGQGLSTADRDAFVNALNAGFTRHARLRDGFLMVNPEDKFQGTSAGKAKLLQAIISFDADRTHASGFSYRSVLLGLELVCQRFDVSIQHKEYYASAFGSGTRIIKLVRKSDADARSLVSVRPLKELLEPSCTQ